MTQRSEERSRILAALRAVEIADDVTVHIWPPSGSFDGWEVRFGVDVAGERLVASRTVNGYADSVFELRTAGYELDRRRRDMLEAHDSKGRGR